MNAGVDMGDVLIALTLIVPLFAAAAIYAVGRMPDVRETLTMIATITLFVLTLSMAMRVGQGDPPAWVMAKPIGGLELSFHLEPLGALFALMASVLWAANSLFSIGYMRGRREANQTRFYVCFALAMFGVMGIAMAANLFTLFIFYEVLTFSTYPLVAHRGDEPARQAGRLYLAMLVGASLTLFLPAIIGIQFTVGTTEFVEGGLLAHRIDTGVASLLLALIVFGAAKAALFPLHSWLPAAMVAPTPVSALLHAVAVVTTGVFVILKVSAYTFGPDLMTDMPVTQWLLWLSAATIVFAALTALSKDDLKARLAWSTIAQLACITSAALLPNNAGIVPGGLHMVTHAFGKITLFMCAGAIFVATGATRVSELSGLGRRMPVTFCCFLVAALSVTGLPPFGGMWSKFLLITASFGSSEWITAAAIILSSFLSLLYLIPVAVRGLLPPMGDAPPRDFILPGGAPGIAVAPAVATAAACLALFFFADRITAYLAPVMGGAR